MGEGMGGRGWGGEQKENEGMRVFAPKTDPVDPPQALVI